MSCLIEHVDATTYDLLEIPLRWELGDSPASRSDLRLPRRKLFYHAGPFLKRSDVSIEAEFAGAEDRVQRLAPQRAQSAVGVIIDTSRGPVSRAVRIPASRRSARLPRRLRPRRRFLLLRRPAGNAACRCAPITPACFSRTACPWAMWKGCRCSSAGSRLQPLLHFSRRRNGVALRADSEAVSRASWASPVSPSIRTSLGMRTKKPSIPAHSGFTASWDSGRRSAISRSRREGKPPRRLRSRAIARLPRFCGGSRPRRFIMAAADRTGSAFLCTVSAPRFRAWARRSPAPSAPPKKHATSGSSSASRISRRRLLKLR